MTDNNLSLALVGLEYKSLILSVITGSLTRDKLTG